MYSGPAIRGALPPIHSTEHDYYETNPNASTSKSTLHPIVKLYNLRESCPRNQVCRVQQAASRQLADQRALSAEDSIISCNTKENPSKAARQTMASLEQTNEL